MIGLYHSWKGTPLPPPLAERFVASLALGLPVRHRACEHGNGTLAAPVHSGPSKSENGALTLFNGQIDNRADILSTLSDSLPKDVPDARLYGAALAKWGDECDLRIIGNYAAITVWPDRGSIRLTTSPIAAPPLHIWSDKERLIVASTPRALFATGEVTKRLNTSYLADVLLFNPNRPETSWFEGANRMPLGCQMHIQNGSVAKRFYYDPWRKGPIRLKSDEEYVEAANTLLREGTQVALRGRSRPAISLSGGFDSQAVAITALELLPETERLNTFTSVPATGWDGRARHGRIGDESDRVRALADMYPRLNPAFLSSDGLGFDHKQDAMFLMGHMPPRNGLNLIWGHEVRRSAVAAGCDVILMGTKGNGTISFDGRGAIPGWLMGGAWARLSREVSAYGKRHSGFMHAFLSQAVMPLLPVSAYRWIRTRRDGPSDDVIGSWCPLDPEFARETGVLDRALEDGFDITFRRPRSTRAKRQRMVSQAHNDAGDVAQALEALHGIPTRDPTGYRPLIEFCLNIPDDQYLRNGTSRWLARRMFKGRMPDQVLHQTKRGQQNADWHLRIGQQRRELLEEIEQMSADPDLSTMLDLKRLRHTLETWDTIDPSARGQQVHLAISRGITMARYVRYVRGTNM